MAKSSNSQNDSNLSSAANIDHIVQLPLIHNPEQEQTRFLLVSGYNLSSSRHDIVSMETALRHITNSDDMQEIEAIYVESLHSVCVLMQFCDTVSCTIAYTELSQVFKTVYYVEDHSTLEEQWICAHCEHSNEFTNNDIIPKRKKSDYLYWCLQCKKVNNPSVNKIKYVYRKASEQDFERELDDLNAFLFAYYQSVLDTVDMAIIQKKETWYNTIHIDWTAKSCTGDIMEMQNARNNANDSENK